MAKKAAKKKAASKKTPAKKKAIRSRGKRAVLAEAPSFSIFSTGGQEQVLEVQQKLQLRGSDPKKPLRFSPLSHISRTMIPVDHFQMQRLFGAVGIPTGAFINIIGRESAGKTTLGYYLLGCAMRNRNARVLAMHWAQKPFYADRALRTMSSNPEHARILTEATTTLKLTTFQEMLDALEAWVLTWRKDQKLPKDIPLVALIDNWSKYLTNDEAKGMVSYGGLMGDEKKKAKVKEIGAGTNMGHAQFASNWSRRLGHMQYEHNLTVIVVNDQTEKISMQKTMPGMQNPELMMSERNKDLRNKTHRGGRSLHQHANIELTMVPGSDIKQGEGGKIIQGKEVWIHTAKSDFSGGERMTIGAELRRDHSLFDREGIYLDPAFHFDEGLAAFLLERKYFGLELNRKRYTSTQLGVLNGTAVDVSIAFHGDPAKVHFVGRAERLQGYQEGVEGLMVSESQLGDPSIWTQEDQAEQDDGSDEEGYDEEVA